LSKGSQKSDINNQRAISSSRSSSPAKKLPSNNQSGNIRGKLSIKEKDTKPIKTELTQSKFAKPIPRNESLESKTAKPVPLKEAPQSKIEQSMPPREIPAVPSRLVESKSKHIIPKFRN
jgi:hypothetical protein